MKPVFLFCILLPTLGFAQQYAINWYKASGGGGTSTNGQYSISGTIGQSDAGGAMTGGSYSLTGGFWSLIAVVATPGAPTLTISNSGSGVIVSWPYPSTGWTLQQNANLANASGWLTSGFTIVNNGTNNSISIPQPAGNLLLRLTK